MCTTETCHHVYLQNLNHEILLPRSMNVERKEAKISKTKVSVRRTYEGQIGLKIVTMLF